MIVVDVETTGVDPKENSIISLGAVDFYNPENCFYGECRLKGNARIDSKALEINGFTIEKINNAKMSCNELLKAFLDWAGKINNKTLAGHNVQFDYNFLLEHFRFYNLFWPFKYRFVDLHSVFYFYLLKKFGEVPLKDNVSNITLDFIIDYFKLKKREGYHNALEDAKLTAEAFSLIIK